MTELDTTNKFLVCGNSRGLNVLNPPISISHDDALLLAAYLVSMAEPFATHKFEDILIAVQST